MIRLINQLNGEIFTLNEANAFGDIHKTGWVLPSTEPVTLNLYLYYDGKHQEKLDEFFEIEKNNRDSLSAEYENYHVKADLYMYLTTEHECNEYNSHRPLEIIEKIGLYLILMNYLISTRNWVICELKKIMLQDLNQMCSFIQLLKPIKYSKNRRIC